MAADQGLILVAKVEPHTAPNAVILILTYACLGEEGRHDTVLPGDTPLSAEGSRVLAAEIAVTGINPEVILQIVREINFIEESRGDINGLNHRSDGGGSAGAKLSTRYALHGPLAVIPFGLRPDMADANAGETIPLPIVTVDANKSLRRIAPKQVAGANVE